MTASYAEEYGVGGPSDDGVGAKVWRAFQQLDDAREEYVAATEQPSLLQALLAPLSGSEGEGVR